MRPLAIVTAVLSAHMWGASVANVWLLWMPGKGATVLVAAAVMAGVIAAVLWVAGIVRDEDRRMLIRLSGDLYRRIPEDDRPPLLRGCDRTQDAQRAR